MTQLQDLIERQAAHHVDHHSGELPAIVPKHAPAMPSTAKTLLLPASLAGRCANGNERDHGRVFHAVPASAHERSFGISAYARSLCGKTHGARSAGWSHDTHAEITCPRCVKLARQHNAQPARPADLPARWAQVFRSAAASVVQNSTIATDEIPTMKHPVAEDSGRGGARENAGRPPIENPRDKVYQLRLNQDERDKLDALGGAAWLRERIKLARTPDTAPAKRGAKR